MSVESIFSPITLAFLVIVIGYCIGKIKIFGISLDLAGVLIVAVAVGYVIASCVKMVDSKVVLEIEAAMKMFSTLGTALFVSVIGISTGYSLNFKQKKDAGAFFVGSIMVISAFITMQLISMMDTQIDYSQLLGAFCGALTTTPGLSAACELQTVIAEEVVLGYGCAYLFGVIFTVLIVQIVGDKSGRTCGESENIQSVNHHKKGFEVIVQLGVVVVLGRSLGDVVIPAVNFSLGNAGGMLCMGIVVGTIVRKRFHNRCASTKVLDLFRNLGLVLFFVGTGIPAGMKLGQGWEIRTMLYGVLLTVVPIIMGYFVCKMIFFRKSSATILAGGMTSTPAIGVLAQKGRDVSFGQYSLAYTGALLTIILLIRTCG